MPRFDPPSPLMGHRALEVPLRCCSCGPRTGATPRRRTRASTRTRPTMLGLTQLSDYLTLKGSFSAVSKPNFPSNYALESSRRDLQNALLCTVLVSLSSMFCLKIAKLFANFCQFLLHLSKVSLDFVDFRAEFFRNFTKCRRIKKNIRYLRKIIATICEI